MLQTSSDAQIFFCVLPHCSNVNRTSIRITVLYWILSFCTVVRVCACAQASQVQHYSVALIVEMHCIAAILRIGADKQGGYGKNVQLCSQECCACMSCLRCCWSAHQKRSASIFLIVAFHASHSCIYATCDSRDTQAPQMHCRAMRRRNSKRFLHSAQSHWPSERAFNLCK